MDYKFYLKEIEHASILETIDEVFNGASALLTPNAVMYGGAVNAVIAGLPIEGDLDIAVSNQEHMTLCKNFASSTKWIQTEGSAIPERNNSRPRLTWTSPPISHSNPYSRAKNMPISKIVSFQTTNNAVVQILESKFMTGDLLEDALEIVRRVDFACCGMAVDRYGRMLETIPGAYSDCRQRVLRIRNYQPRLDPVRVKQRMFKYIKRGWSLAIDMNTMFENLEKAKEEYRKKMEEKEKKRKSKTKRLDPLSEFETRLHTKRGLELIIRKDIIAAIGSRSMVVDIVTRIARSSEIRLKWQSTTAGTLVFTGDTPKDAYHFTRGIAKMISDKTVDRLKKVSPNFLKRYAMQKERREQLVGKNFYYNAKPKLYHTMSK